MYGGGGGMNVSAHMRALDNTQQPFAFSECHKILCETQKIIWLYLRKHELIQNNLPARAVFPGHSFDLWSFN